MRAGDTPLPLLPHQRAQRQPVVRIHPVTGQPALYLCESGQMDWIVGPIVDMTPGPDRDGEKRSWIPEDGSRPAEGLDDRVNLND